MTKKHFEAMADYLAEAKQEVRALPLEGENLQAWDRYNASYQFALYLCNKFGERFDRARFDAWIERKVKA